MTDPRRALIVGVAGGSGSGKSTVAHAVARSLGPGTACVIDMDAYYRDFASLSPDELRAVNWDHPDALDLDRLASDLEQLAAGSPVDKPRYDFTLHRRRPEAERVEPHPVVIIEGILLFVDARVRAACEMKIYVDAEADLRLIRRLRRDMRDRARRLDEILEQYLTTVRPMHEEFVEPSKRWADLIVPRGGHNDVAIEMLVANIQRRLLVPASP
ncbi:MAG TPA: uridine kinase [Gemmatimonadaceae bacterium]|nr:uridine kinase [Gemmatimonadaceae bacterium]